jgi:multidrug resistance efflux pump
MQGKWLLAAGAVLIFGLGGWALWRLQALPVAAPATVAAPVPAAATGTAANPNEISLSGRVQPQKVVPVAAPVDGVLENLTVREGEEVAEGQLLARVKNDNLDTEQTQQEQEVSRLQSKVTSLEASIIAARLEAQRTKSEAENSRASLEIMRKGFERQTLLRKEGATPRLAFEKAERELKNAQAESDARGSQERQAQDNFERLTKQLDEARRQLSAQSEEWERSKADLNSAEIHAPATGILAKVNKQNGDAVSAADKELFLIGVDLAALEVVVELTPDELKRVKPGMPAAVSLVENNNEPLPGVLKEIQETSGYIEFASPNPAIVPGLIAQVRILLNGTLVPVTPPPASSPASPVKPVAPLKK